MSYIRTSLFRVSAWLSKPHWSLLLLFAGVLVPLWAFGEIAEDVVDREKFFFDELLLRFIHRHASLPLDRIMLFFSLAGNRFGVIPVGVIGFIYLLSIRRWGDALFWGIALGGAGLLNLIAKPYFGRIRPELWLSLAPETTFSFPSGHAMGSMALAAVFFVLAWPTPWRWFAITIGSLFVLLVGLSRVYLGVHYPSDILAGWAASLSWVMGVSFIFYRKPIKPRARAEPT